MASKYCLLKPLAEEFKRALKNGKIKPQEIEGLSSVDRKSRFAEIVGEDDAVRINELFESKLLLQDKQRAMIAWAKEITGIKPEVRRDILSKIEKMDSRILDPINEKAFLEDLAAKRLGAHVTFEEAKNITSLSEQAKVAKANWDDVSGAWKDNESRLQYGASLIKLKETIDNAKDPYHGLGMGESVKEIGKDALARVRKNPITGAFGVAKDAVGDLMDLSISVVASLDNSFLGRQGLHTLQTHPSAWWPAAKQSFSDIVQSLGGKRALETVMADVHSRPNAMNGAYKTAKMLDLNEELFTSSFAEKIPGFGRVYKASEAAFKGSALRMRADLFDLLVDNAKRNGVDIGDKAVLEGYGRLVNALTAKGELGKYGKASTVVLWAPRMLKANFDVLTAHTLDAATGRITPKQWGEALTNAFKIYAITAALMGVANALKPGSAETDPRSSAFGKINIGGSHYIDITGGAGSMVTLLSRLWTGSSKSVSSGAIYKYGNEQPGQKTRKDAVYSFLENKTTPPVKVLIDILQGENFKGEKPTIANEAYSLSVPISLQNIFELAKKFSAEGAFGVASDFVGLSSSNYEDRTSVGRRFVGDEEKVKVLHDISNAVGKPVSFTDWDKTTQADILEFKNKLSPSEWDNAKSRYDFQIKERVDEALNSEKFKALSEEDKVRYLNQIDTDAKNKVFSQFNFKKQKIPKAKKIKI